MAAVAFFFFFYGSAGLGKSLVPPLFCSCCSVISSHGFGVCLVFNGMMLVWNAPMLSYFTD